jgi:hypothetical protein
MALPTDLEVASPAELTVATLGCELDQVTNPVTSWVVLSVKVPVAVNCAFWPNAIEEVAGVTRMEVNAALETVTAACACTAPTVAFT